MFITEITSISILTSDQQQNITYSNSLFVTQKHMNNDPYLINLFTQQ